MLSNLLLASGMVLISACGGDQAEPTTQPSNVSGVADRGNTLGRADTAEEARKKAEGRGAAQAEADVRAWDNGSIGETGSGQGAEPPL